MHIKLKYSIRNHRYVLIVRFGVFTVLVATSCSDVIGHQRAGGPSRLHLQSEVSYHYKAKHSRRLGLEYITWLVTAKCKSSYATIWG